jgi:solute:Na+ symporter, SSS family
MQISTLDIIVITAYLLGITAFGIWVGYRKNASSQQYFLANKSLGWFTVGAAVFTSNISTIHLVGLAAGGAKDGLVIGNFEWMACFTLILLALLFAPFYVNTKVATLPEFMERRYSPQARTFLAVIGLFGALFVHIGISLFAAAKVFESFLGVPMIWTIIVLSIFTFIYTVLGGLKAVVMTENLQVVLLLGGAILLTILGLRALPDVGVFNFTDFKASAFPGQLQMLQPIVNKEGNFNGFSWLTILLGYPILGIWYWCADQTHVQRVLAAKSLKNGQNGALFAGFLKITPVFLMVLPGVIGYILWQKGAFQLPNVVGTNSPDYNTMLPSLVNYLVPTGLKGLLAASMAAALMSCMAAALNSCATLVSFDIVKRTRPNTPDKQLVYVGRITTAVIMVLAILWSTQGDQFGTIFEAINKIPMTFAPAVTTVFVMGVLWKRGTKEGAMATLYLGSFIGVLYFILDMPKLGRYFCSRAPHEGFLGLISDNEQGLGIPFMMVGPILAVVCIIIYIIASLRSPAMDRDEVAKVCWDHPLSFLRGTITGPSDPRMVTLYLILSVTILYIIIYYSAK